MNTHLLISLMVLSFFGQGYAQTAPDKIKKYSVGEIKEDLEYLYKALQDSHYNLFVFTNKKSFDRAYDKLQSSVKDSLTFIDANRLVQPFLAMSGLAHCNSYPFSPAYVDYAEHGGTVFPFNVAIDKNRMWISSDYTKGHSIGVGDEVLEINGVPVAKRLAGIYHYLSGENDYFKSTLIEMFHIARVYWLVYGEAGVFELKLKNAAGEVFLKKVAPISVGVFEDFAAQEKPVFNNKREFKFIEGIAYLHPGAFSNAEGNGNSSEHKTFEKGEFMDFIDASFNNMKDTGAKSLVLDLRGNPGGDNSFSDPLLAYFASEPFSFCSRFLVKTSAVTKSFWKDVQDSSLAELRKEIMEKPDGTIFETAIKKQLPVPDALRFKGRVYVLIDRYSYSNAVTTAATIQDYKWGILIGEDTADVPTTYAAIHEFYLPNTKMPVSYPKAFIVRPNGNTSLRPLQPDVKVEKAGDKNGDETLKKALELAKS